MAQGFNFQFSIFNFQFDRSMSVIALDIRVFQTVENKLQSFGACNYYDSEHSGDFPRQAFNLQQFSGNNIYELEKFDKAVTEWITEAFRFNQVAYCCRYKRNEFLANYQPSRGTKKISLVECYKLLQCIIYNSDIDSYMVTESYERLKPEFEAWREKGEKMLHFIAAHIVAHLPEYDQAKWASI